MLKKQTNKNMIQLKNIGQKLLFIDLPFQVMSLLIFLFIVVFII